MDLENSRDVETTKLDNVPQQKKIVDFMHTVDPRFNLKETSVLELEEGPSSIVQHIENANTYTTSSLSFNVILPSMSTILSRKALITCPMQFDITGQVAAGTTAAPSYLIDPTKSCLAPFPFFELVNTVTLTVNNASITYTMLDLKQQLQRLYDQKTLREQSSLCPVKQDFFYNYSDESANANSDVFSDASNLNYDGIPGRNSFIYSITNPGNTGATGTGTASVFVNVSEPLLLPLFLLSEKHKEAQGLYGMSSLKINFTFVSGFCRAFRALAAGSSTISSVVFKGFYKNGSSTSMTAPKLLLKFLSPKPTLKLNPRQVVPYNEIMVYKTVGLTTIAGVTGGVNVDPTIVSLQSNNFQLNQIPSYILIYARPSPGSQNNYTSDYWLPITGISLTFNNRAGLLSNHSQQELWALSRENGLNVSWSEWSGKIFKCAAGDSSSLLATVGGPLLLRFGKDIPIEEPFLSAGSIGQFQFSFTLNVFNQDTNAQPSIELCAMVINPSILVTSLGNSASYIGLASKQDVMETMSKPVEDVGKYKNRSIKYGGGFHNRAQEAIEKTPLSRAFSKMNTPNKTGSSMSAGNRLQGRLF